MTQDIYMKYKKKFCPKWCPHYRFDCDEKCADEKAPSPADKETSGEPESDSFQRKSNL